MNSNSQMTMAFRLRVRHVWVHGFLIGLLIGTLCFGASYFINSLSAILTSEENASQSLAKPSEESLPAEPKISPQPRLDPEANLELQLVQVVEAIKETTLKKDLKALSQLYSASFPNLSNKLKKIDRSWKTYDYETMNFKIQKLQHLTDDAAVAWITWDVAVKEIATGKTKDVSKTYKVNFIKESEQWHIIGLENVGL